MPKQKWVSPRIGSCVLRHLSEDSAFATPLSRPAFKDNIIGVGLDFWQVGNPPAKFEKVFAKRERLVLTVAHAGES